MSMDAHNQNPPFFPDEIITNILKRLPLKPLFRFQCVSKHWKNIIKTPSFIQHHHHHQHQNPNLLIQQSLRDHPLHFSLLTHHNMQSHAFDYNTPIWMNFMLGIVDSFNGLVCLFDYNTLPPVPVLWNPVTQEVRRVLHTPHFDFDGIPNGWYFGFGFSPVVNDYKIVRFSETDMIYQVQVCSLRTGTWEYTYAECLRGVSLYSHGVTVNGFMFWYGKILHYYTGTDDRDVIVSFDLVSQEFTVTPSPVFLSHIGVKLSVYDDKLAVISNSSRINSKRSRVYFGVMEEMGTGSSESRWSSSWKYVFNSAPSKLYAETVWMNKIVYTEYEKPRVSPESEVEMENAEPKGWLYLIDVSTNERKRLAIPGYLPGFSASVRNYVESFVRIGDIQD